MKNFVQKGRVVTLAMPYDRLSGQGVLVGSIFGVCAYDAVSGASSEVQVSEVFDVTKDTSVFAVGDKVFWDDSAKKCSATAASNNLVGYATKAQLTGDTTVRVRLKGGPIAAATTVAAVSTATATDLATSEALANQLKTSLNAVIAALKAAGLMQ